MNEPDVVLDPAVPRGGWAINPYTLTVARAWSTRNSSGPGEPPTTTGRYRLGNYGSQRLWSTKRLALLALRHEVAAKAERDLARIDKQLEQT